MRIHWLQHVPFEGLGSIEPWAANRQYQVTATRLYQGESLPTMTDLDWLIIMGGTMNVYEHEHYPWLTAEKRFIEAAIKAGKTVLGICLGAQLIADVLGAKVYPNGQKEIGWWPIQLTAEGRQCAFFPNAASEIEVFQWHGDTFELPRGAVQIARSAVCEQQAFLYVERVAAFQFHLETTAQSAQQLIAHCGDELVSAPYIQTAEHMLANPLKFQRINRIMTDLLHQLAKEIVSNRESFVETACV